MVIDRDLTDAVNSGAFALKARWVFPVSAAPIADGIVQVEQGQIVGVCPLAVSGPTIDLGNVAILPGLVNAHTHLEFSDLDEPLGRAGMPFDTWIHEVIQYRQQRIDKQDAAPSQQEILERGASECLRSGTTTLGEIATAPIPSGVPDPATIHCTLFHEVLGLSQQRVAASLESLTSWLDEMQQDKKTVRPAVSPHAPYSVSELLLERTIRLSRERRIPLAMHLAESPEELELLASHSGPIVELFARLGFWDPSALARGKRPRDVLEQLTNAHRVLIIHGNYLIADELSLLADHRDHMSVVYCPRTHAYFRHGPYPLLEMLDQGVNVALGTDSRASNPDLSLWKEMLFVARHYPHVPPERILVMGTLAGAKALGVDDCVGSLDCGKQADLCIVALPDQSSDAWESLLYAESVVQATILQGRFLDTG